MRFTALLWLALALQAQDGAAPGAQAPATKKEGLCSLEGRVLNAVTGEPVGKAEARLVGPDARPGDSPRAPVMSDEAGKFAIGGIEPGKYVLVVQHAGYGPSYGPAGAFNADSMLSFERGAAPKEIVVRLMPNAVISGRVENEDGEPVAGIQVSAFRFVYSPAKRLLAVGNGTTAKNGEYRIADLPAGKYYVGAQPRDVKEVALAPADPDTHEDYVMSYYPGTPRFEAAVALDTPLGAQLTNINVRLKKTRTVCVRIRVIDPGRSFEKLSVVLGTRSSQGPTQPYFAPRTEVEGEHEACRVAPGSYFGYLSRGSDADLYVMRQAIEVGDENSQVFNITPLPQADVGGSLRVEGDVPFQPAGIKLRLRAFEAAMFPSPELTLKDSPAFVFPKVNPEHYGVEVSGVPDGLYLKAIRSGDVDVLAKGLEVAGSAPPRIEILLSPNGGRISGTVQDAQGGRAGAVVALIPWEEERRSQTAFYRAALTETGGLFELTSVPPGEYRIVALEQVGAGEVLDPEYLKPLLSRGEPVEMREKGGVNVRLKLISATDVH